MFRTQNWKQALGLMALGSVFTIIGLSLSPVTAQRDKFGDIECTKLTVVDADGNVGLEFRTAEHGGLVGVYGKDGKAVLGGDERGVVVFVVGRGGRAGMAVNEHGGIMQVTGKGEGAAVMSINKYGGGAVFTRDKNGD